MVEKKPSPLTHREPPGELVTFEWMMIDSGYQISRGRFSPPELYPLQIRFGWEEPFDQEEVMEWRHTPGSNVLHISPAQDEPALFKIFSELEGAPDILAFANTYGLLHDSEFRGHLKPDGTFGTGEPVAYWRYWIGKVRSVVRLLDGLGGDISVMNHFQVFERPTDGVRALGYFSHPEFAREMIEWDRLLDGGDGEKAWEAGRRLPIGCDWTRFLNQERVATAYRKRDVRLLSREILAFKLAAELGRPGAFSYDGDPDGLDHVRIGFRATIKQEEGRLAIRLVPQSLLDLIWLQAAQAATGGREYRRCAKCTRWFAVLELGRRRRSDRIYCSSACKTRAFRDKQGQEQGKKA